MCLSRPTILLAIARWIQVPLTKALRRLGKRLVQHSSSVASYRPRKNSRLHRSRAACCSRLHPKSCSGRPASSSRPQLRVMRVVGAPTPRGASACACSSCVSPFLMLRTWLCFGLCAPYQRLSIFLKTCPLPLSAVFACPSLCIFMLSRLHRVVSHPTSNEAC